NEDCFLNGPSQNGIFWTVIDQAGGRLASTCSYTYPGTNQLKSVTIRFDGNEPNWYTGTGSPGVGNLDLKSVATHEIGHAGGFWDGHWNNAFPADHSCDQDSAIHTMRAYTTWYLCHSYWRTLQPHDIHTFDNRY